MFVRPELGGVTQIPLIVNITEQLSLEQGEGDDGDSTVLVHCPVVTLQPENDVLRMCCSPLDPLPESLLGVRGHSRRPSCQ